MGREMNRFGVMRMEVLREESVSLRERQREMDVLCLCLAQKLLCVGIPVALLKSEKWD